MRYLYTQSVSRISHAKAEHLIEELDRLSTMMSDMVVEGDIVKVDEDLRTDRAYREARELFDAASELLDQAQSALETAPKGWK